MNKFNVGDTVEIVGSSWSGDKGIVNNVPNVHSNIYTVKVIESKSRISRVGGFYEKDLRLSYNFKVGDKVKTTYGTIRSIVRIDKSSNEYSSQHIPSNGMYAELNNGRSIWFSLLTKVEEVDNIQDKTIDYLTNGSEDRRNAMKDLMGRGFFNSTNTAAERILTQYLADNPRQFCATGIENARKALLPVKEPLRGTFVVEIVCNDDEEGETLDNLRATILNAIEYELDLKSISVKVQ